MKMKRLNILLSVLALGVAAGCAREELPETAGNTEGKRITYDLSLSIPDEVGPATKAMADVPSIQNIYVVVFGGSNYLNEFSLAIPLNGSNQPNVDGSGNYIYEKVGGVYKVRISLEQTTSRRSVHILANVPEGNIPPDFDTADKVLGEYLYTSNGLDGYWGYHYFGSGVNAGNIGELNGMKLVRNFVKISLAPGSSGYTVLGFELYGTPTRGSFAPYVSSSDSFYTGWETAGDPTTYSTLVAAYAGYLMPGSTPLYMPSYTAGTFPENTDAKYMYEHPADDANPTFIIAKLEKAGVAKYFRLDIVDGDGAKSALLRNYHYIVTLKTISSEGYDSPEVAAENPSDFNMTLSEETQDIPAINNYGAFMEVSYVEKVFTKAASDVVFHYRYDADYAGSHDYKDGVVSAVSGEDGVSIDGWTEDFTGATVTDNWREFTYDVADPSALGSDETVSTFTITAGEGKKMIRRRVNIIRMKPKTLEVVNWAYDDGTKELALSFRVPEGLRSSMFPLHFRLQTDDKDTPGKQVLSPQGGDMISDYDANAKIYFLKDYQYSDYQAGRTITIPFKAPETVTPVIKITDDDGYFVPLNLGAFFATGLAADPIAKVENGTTTFEFVYTPATMKDITLSLTNLTAVSSATGTLSGSTYTPNNVGTQRIVVRANDVSSDGEVSLTLDAITQSLMIRRYDTYVSGGIVQNGDLPLGTGKSATISFNYTAHDLIPLTIKASDVDLYSADGSAKLADAGTGYNFTPSAGINTFTIKSKTRFGNAGTISLDVQGSHAMSNPSPLTVKRATQFVIPAEALTLSGATSFNLPMYWRTDKQHSTSGTAGQSYYFSSSQNTGNIIVDITPFANADDSTPVHFMYTYTGRFLVFIPYTVYMFADTTLGALIDAAADNKLTLTFGS